ncbi:MAG: helix-turn-helix domain-containing protein [Shewanella sp.]|nr:helix-turn-helix domain-containing protein [Shewanella sp.]MCF1430412.1 helix-turn-helix domain-containing protein [Shewanella sp.]MCF1439124.1 helix-turn-helix domain-containing protein [Shewanella sp.]MCF1457951.1 helix-turn-helix domain-containing protein [Shewanella sp.]
MKTWQTVMLLVPMPDFNLLPFAGFLDKLRFSADDEDYSRHTYCHWTIAGLNSESIRASCGAQIQPEYPVDELALSEFDVLVLFGGRSTQTSIELAPAYRPLLQQARRTGLTVVSVDNACFTLAESGMFQSGPVAVHWRHLQEFASRYPELQASADNLYLLEGKRGSCMGGTAAIELAAVLLARYQGRRQALKGLADMLVDEPRTQMHRVKSLPDVQVPQSRHVHRAILLMRQHLDGGSVTWLANELGIGRRQLDRLFDRHFQQTASRYWDDLRLSYICWRLTSSTLAVKQLALELGFDDLSNFNHWFKRLQGVTPAQYRRAQQHADRQSCR